MENVYEEILKNLGKIVQLWLITNLNLCYLCSILFDNFYFNRMIERK